MIELRLLGNSELRLEGRAVHSFLAGPKRLGLLVYLVLARPRGFQRRDKILSLFWPARGQKAGRNALSNMLYHIRRELGERVIVRRGDEEVGIRSEAIICDAVAFEKALERGDVEQALEWYRGDLLEGFYVSGAASEFHQWLDGERERLRGRAAEAAWRHAEEAERAGDRGAARTWAMRAAAFTPFSDEAHARLIRLLTRMGDRAVALAAYDTFAARLRQEWAMEPTAEVQAAVDGVQTGAPAKAASSRPNRAHRPANRSIAVLPFETVGAVQPSAFTEGVHSDLLTRLSNISDLQVISRTSIRRYRSTDKTLPEIGAELDVPWVLEGEVQETAGQVRLNIRLVDAHTDRQTWARDYRRSLTAQNLFQIQGEIAKEIALSLEAELTPREMARIEHRPTESLDAYRLHAQGRRYLDLRTEEGMRRALDYFEQAIEQDSGYALAWVGLADAFTLRYEYGYEDTERALHEAEWAVRQALELDATLAEAHASLGLLHEARRHGPQAIRELQQAVELKPSYAEAHNWLSWVHQLVGHPKEALERAKRAVELDPLSPEAVSNLAASHLVNGDYGQALAEARRDQELGTSWGTGRFYEGLALYRLGRFEEATSVLRGLSVPWADVGPRATVALAHVASGDLAEARAVLAQFEEAGHSFAAGLVQAALGEAAAAIDAFRRVERWGDYWPTLAVRYYYRNVWNALQAELRYKELLRQVDRSWTKGE